MSAAPARDACKQHRKATNDDTSNWTFGQSFNAGQRTSPLRSTGIEAEAASTEISFISKLPAAVASVSLEDKKSYVHSKRVTNYLVGNTLGEGSFAKVKEGFHLLVGEKVAVKIIDKKKAEQDPYVNKNFRREARLLQMVHHPNILQLLEVVETDNSYYLITELCSGGELMKHIYNEKQLGEKETRRYMRQMVSAVDHLHRAGIIHRDLKVENLLLDSQGCVKIIDFGLSNEEFTVEEGRRIHCSTQCGSPAYAAPELLGHKPYGPEVDVWSLGVNMYAMLTGCLPYTVEPFNITALHAKMLENKMNPIPTSLSSECTDLLCGLLNSDPAQRIKMAEIMVHPWMVADGSSALKPHPYPNRLTANDINEDIVEHMVHVLKLKEREEEVTAELLTDRACAISSVYHLLQARLDRYNLMAKSKVKLRKKSKYEAQVGYRPPSGDDDCHSTMSYPARGGREHNPNRVHLRPISRQKVPGGGEPVEDSRLRERRKTLPSELMKAEIDKMNSNLPRESHPLLVEDQRSPQLPPPALQRTTGTLPRPLRNRQENPLLAHRAGQDPPQRPTTQLNPVRPRPAFPTSISHPKDLNKLRHDMNRHAWVSQPPSQASLSGSKRHSSRPSSRQPSATPSKYPSQNNRRSCPDYDDLDFHKVESISSPSRSCGQRKVSQAEAESVHFPSLTPHSGRGNRQRSRSHDHRDHTSPIKQARRTNGHWSPSHEFEFVSESSTSGLLSELGRVVQRLNISLTSQKGHTLHLKSQSTKFQVHVDQDSQGVCRLKFQWLQGGSQEHYSRLCSDIFKYLST